MANTLQTQLRELRIQLEEIETEKNLLEKSKRGVDARYEELNEQFTSVNQVKLTLEKNNIVLENENRELKSHIDEAREQADTEGDKARIAEQARAELTAQLQREKDAVNDLSRSNAQLEKTNKEYQLRIVDLESAVKGDMNKNFKKLESKLYDMTAQLDKVTRERDDLQQTSRRNERLIRDLQSQVAEKERIRQRQDDELNKTQDKLRKMKQDIMDLEGRESDLQLAKKRAERDAEDHREKSTRLEREMERFRATARATPPTL